MSSPLLTDNDFVILGIAQQFAQLDADLQQRWKSLQTQMHPDRFAAQGDAAQRLATQWSVRINEAYQRIKNPLSRAALLCELAGVPVNAETNTSMPTHFLVQQMQWREQLEEAQSFEQVEQLREMVTGERTSLLVMLADVIDKNGNYEQAVQEVRRLMFIERFLKDIDTKLDTLDR